VFTLKRISQTIRYLLEVHSDGYNMDICFAQSQTQYFTMILNQANQYKLMFYSHPCGNIVISNSDNTIWLWCRN